MGKAKATKPALSGPQKTMHTRISYLYQAATYLATQQSHALEVGQENAAGHQQASSKSENSERCHKNLVRPLVTDLRAILNKAQLRVTPEMKQWICKNCDTIMVEGSTCTRTIENRSKGGRKHWADVILRRCTVCEKETRVPLTSLRQKRKPNRLLDGVKAEERDIER